MSFLDSVTPRKEDALTFFQIWFKGVADSELVTLVRMHPSGRPHSFTFTLEEIKGALENSGLEPLIWANETQYDLYFSVSTLKEKPEKGKRGKLSHVKLVPGVWCDLDVKEGYFTSQAQILEFLDSQRERPTLVVLTGNSGVHAYWKFQRALGLHKAQELALRWWVHQSDIAGVKIDKLVDPSRMMRIPGSIRWPKKSSEGTAVCKLHTAEKYSYGVAELESVTERAWEEYQSKIKKTRDGVIQKSHDAKEFARTLAEAADNPMMRLLAISEMEDHFNETYSWDSILEPQGWTKLGTDDDQRVIWSRPGDGVRKSATTDWPESPHVMSLFSTAPETGLSDLHDSGIVLTKYRVWIELVWGGDEVAAVEQLLKA